MLHHHNGLFAGQAGEQFGGALHFLFGHAGDRFVHQQQARLLHQQHTDFQPLLLAMGEDTGEAVPQVFQADHFQHFIDAVPELWFHHGGERGQYPLVRRHGQLQVLEHGEGFEHRGFLELAADAQRGDVRLVHGEQVVAAAEPHRAGVWPGFTGDDVHHGGFAGAVGADNAAQFTVVDGEVEVVDGLEAVKAHVHAFQVQDGAVAHVHRGLHRREEFEYLVAIGQFLKNAHAAASCPVAVSSSILALRRFCSSPAMPLGRNTVTSTNRPPRANSQASGMMPVNTVLA